jgi:hypothetical protein
MKGFGGETCGRRPLGRYADNSKMDIQEAV